eukprot:CAMPEP_0201595420 /NCGR_PEP_ID=MMETSP0190_2-20130828/192427_1 /ASSEMBLY_ACC=CAM_ASM_000263 /TAXON_ID=37353 /ORGANISM="Rosalina sp." /LENGTH=50 /DNA_ID=CAMNT_0048055397 /DNA_START=1245 /DNA_END=1397 /DNA_ORIENTATION=+
MSYIVGDDGDGDGDCSCYNYDGYDDDYDDISSTDGCLSDDNDLYLTQVDD